jgi:hypothetical protein
MIYMLDAGADMYRLGSLGGDINTGAAHADGWYRSFDAILCERCLREFVLSV